MSFRRAVGLMITMALVAGWLTGCAPAPPPKPQPVPPPSGAAGS